jgi:hypothetical protein
LVLPGDVIRPDTVFSLGEPVGLYDRLIGTESPKIPVHQFQATLGEFARNRMNGAQAQAAIEFVSGAPLDQTATAEAQTLLGTVSGSATARLARVTEIDHVLMLAEVGVSGYNTAALLKTRLGV